MSLQSAWREMSRRRFAALAGFVLLFLAISSVVRIVLFSRAWTDTPHNVGTLAAILGWGVWFDVATVSYASIPLIIFLTLMPGRWWSRAPVRSMLFLLLLGSACLCVFTSVAEWLFWSEFGVRFNFIAVDYLIYTTEVLANIRESYPLPWILSGVGISGLILTAIVWRSFVRDSIRSESMVAMRFSRRLAWGIVLLAVPCFFSVVLSNRSVPGFGNNYAQELAKNGIYSFFAEFRNNELPYDQFYSTNSVDSAFLNLRKRLDAPNSRFLSNDPIDITRAITNAGPEKRWNIIQITVESLSSEFLGAFGNSSNLTPNLDALSRESLFFTHFYATGNRTVRGMEALTLSVPPTPGQSIVRRPGNENLFTLGSLLKSRGYDTSFIYGGFGYFDNMNYFFGNNGYRVLDRSAVSKEEITFANAWGACDGDVYNWALKQADASHAAGKPFHQFIMTTSNHRPFTYPEGKIDLPPKISDRNGAVKYTDFAIGEFIREAQKRPWFDNTLFVIVADHCANSAGMTALPVKNYEIPLIIYNPHLVKSRRVERLCSQIDLAPTLLGLMDWSYSSRFFGKDILKTTHANDQVLIANYQKLGCMTSNRLEILSPVRKEQSFDCDLNSGILTPGPQDSALLMDAISYYQTGSYLFRHQLMKAPHAD